jgi:hypothetical protein
MPGLESVEREDYDDGEVGVTLGFRLPALGVRKLTTKDTKESF